MLHNLNYGAPLSIIIEAEWCIYASVILSIIGSDNGLSPGRRQAIIWTNAGILLIGPLGTNFSEILTEIHTFSFKKMHLKMSSGKWWPFCLGLNVLRSIIIIMEFHNTTITILELHYRITYFEAPYMNETDVELQIVISISHIIWSCLMHCTGIYVFSTGFNIPNNSFVAHKGFKAQFCHTEKKIIEKRDCKHLTKYICTRCTLLTT